MTEGRHPVMTGAWAAEIVKEQCLTKRHQLSEIGSSPIVCSDCSGTMEHLRAVDRDRPPLQATTVYFVADVNGTLGVRATMSEVDANEKAREYGAVVVSWPVSADYRRKESTDG